MFIKIKIQEVLRTIIKKLIKYKLQTLNVKDNEDMNVVRHFKAGTVRNIVTMSKIVGCLITRDKIKIKLYNI